MKYNYFILILLSILTTIILSLASFFSFQNLVTSMLYRRAIDDRKEEFNILLSNLKDAETGQRGYIITGKEEYLEPYYSALQIIDRHLVEITGYPHQSSRQKLLIEELTHFIQLKLAHLNNTLNLRRTEGFEAAQKLVASTAGKIHMDNIREITQELIEDQTQELKKTDQKIQIIMNRSLLFNILGGILSSLLIILFSFLFYRDSVELGKIKRQFRETSGLQQAILDSAKQMIITTDTEGIITSFNKGAEKILGYKANEVINKVSILDLYDTKALKKRAEELTQTKPTPYSQFDALVAPSRYFLWIDSEWLMKKKDQTLFPCSQSISVLRNESNNISGYLFIGSDVTDFKKWEQELHEAQEAIDIAQLSKNRFLASLNHELRAPLNSIMNFAMLLMKNVGGNLKELEITYATRIKEISQSILNTINEILDISKRKDKIFPSGSSIVPLYDLVKEKIDQLENIPNVKFLIEIPKDAILSEVDKEKFESLLNHLLRHLINHYTGQLIIRVKTDPQTSQLTEIQFIQNEKASDQETGDLLIAKSLANQTGYQIQKTKFPGTGAIFRLLLPLQRSATGLETGQEKLTKTNLDRNFSDMTILIIDDDADFRSLLTAYLEDLGCHVIQAASGPELIQIAKNQQVDLITMDMLMSPMNGYDVVQQLQNDPQLKEIPFAFISIIAKEIKNKIPGALDFINKPVTKENLTHLLQKVRPKIKF